MNGCRVVTDDLVDCPTCDGAGVVCEHCGAERFTCRCSEDKPTRNDAQCPNCRGLRVVGRSEVE